MKFVFGPLWLTGLKTPANSIFLACEEYEARIDESFPACVFFFFFVVVVFLRSGDQLVHTSSTL